MTPAPVYGFYDECKRRTNIKTWKTFIDVFNTLPIASIVASKIFCVHGGLSPSLKSMDDIRRIVRPTGEFKSFTYVQTSLKHDIPFWGKCGVETGKSVYLDNEVSLKADQFCRRSGLRFA